MRSFDASDNFIHGYIDSLRMETFTKARPLVPSPGYDTDRREALVGLNTEIGKGSTDEPTLDILMQFSNIPFCYTLQSCYGHFMLEPSTADRNTKRVVDVAGKSSKLHYRIAYVAFCVQNSDQGLALLEDLKAIADVDPDYIQFGSADWFWKACVNSYVLQVSPLRNAFEDSFEVSTEMAMRIERTRDMFFDRLREVLSKY